MTEQEYEKLVEDAAWERLKIIARYLDDKQLKYLREGDKSETVKTWRNAVKWARENPPPEVQELVEALDRLGEWEKYIRGWNPVSPGLAARSQALARFKERTAGKGEE